MSRLSVCLPPGYSLISLASDVADPADPQYLTNVTHAQQLIRQFLAELNEDLTFQSVEEELQQLPGKYSESLGGCLLLLVFDGNSGSNSGSISSIIDRRDVIPVGTVALRRLDDGIGEIKRMFIKPDQRGRGLSRVLLSRLLEEARVLHYHTLRLDTLTRLTAANALYRSMGFYEIPPYYFNPINDVLYLEYAVTTV